MASNASHSFGAVPGSCPRRLRPDEVERIECLAVT